MTIVYYLIVCGFIAAGGRRLGYSGFVWFFAALTSAVFSLGFLATLPDRNLERRRAQMLAGLRGEVAQANSETEDPLNVLQTIRE